MNADNESFGAKIMRGVEIPHAHSWKNQGELREGRGGQVSCVNKSEFDSFSAISH